MAGRVSVRHCERSEAIHLAAQKKEMDCFVALLLAMTCLDSNRKMNHDAYDDNYIRGILNSVKSIAMVGASPVNVRPSYFAFKYLAQRGYDMIPVNPGHVGKSLIGKAFRRFARRHRPARRHDRHLSQLQPHHAGGR